MPRLRNFSYRPATDDVEGDLHAEARRQGVTIYYNSQSRRAGLPHVEIKAGRQLLKAFESAGAALEWLRSAQ